MLHDNEDGDDFAIKTRAVGVRVSSEQCEIEGNVLGIKVALQCYEEKHVEGHGGCVYIFCDCQSIVLAVDRRSIVKGDKNC